MNPFPWPPIVHPWALGCPALVNASRAGLGGGPPVFFRCNGTDRFFGEDGIAADLTPLDLILYSRVFPFTWAWLLSPWVAVSRVPNRQLLVFPAPSEPCGTESPTLRRPPALGVPSFCKKQVTTPPSILNVLRQARQETRFFRAKRGRWAPWETTL